MKITFPRNRQLLQLRPEVPDGSACEPIEGASCFTAAFESGRLFVQRIRDGGFTIWRNTYRLVEKTELRFQITAPLLALYLQQEGTAVWTYNNHTTTVQAGQWLLLFLPAGDLMLHLEAGATVTTSLLLTKTYLKGFREQYPVLESILDQADRNEAALLPAAPLTATRQLLKLFEQLRRCEFRNGFRTMFFEARVMDILMEVLPLAAGTTKLPFRLSREDVIRILEVKTLLETQPELRLTVRQLARRVLLNESKLRKGFREVTGMNLFDFHLEVRMQRAKLLLEEAKLPLEDIAEQTGYVHLSSFIAAFREINGVTPAVYRRIHSK